MTATLAMNWTFTMWSPFESSARTTTGRRLNQEHARRTRRKRSSEQRVRRRPGQRANVARHVRLVVVAVVGGGPRPALAATAAQHVLHPRDPHQALRSVP